MRFYKTTCLDYKARLLSLILLTTWCFFSSGCTSLAKSTVETIIETAKAKAKEEATALFERANLKLQEVEQKLQQKAEEGDPIAEVLLIVLSSLGIVGGGTSVWAAKRMNSSLNKK
ncbi:MAG: hypothetical protein KatS3mg087_1315 [Patescibacteria group bacterium]|nr:MAG: hypothetical protein KatS3mg087_1315 [Patescibacteria group bacterium]